MMATVWRNRIEVTGSMGMMTQLITVLSPNLTVPPAAVLVSAMNWIEELDHRWVPAVIIYIYAGVMQLLYRCFSETLEAP